ncbi:MAG TPA: FkbM family methyltransferase, partial [Streptosporangiaceae bacterium]|nr:FkbM family methyltransferase [Streptosporangiaceae bacterium]
RLANVSVVAAAIGSSTATMPLYVPNRQSGWMSLHPRRDSFARNEDFTSRDVEVIKLDDLLKEKKLEHVDFLKMDLEGHELFALRGAGAFLEKGRISALSFEFGSANINSRTFFRDFWDLLVPLGYSIARIAPRGRIIRIRGYDETLEFFRGATNYIATLAA